MPPKKTTSKSPKYWIGNKGFPSQKAVKEHVSAVLDEIGWTFVSKDHPKFEFFCELLQNHPNYAQKWGSGVEGFQLTPNPTTGRDYHLILHRSDGSKEAASWNACCGLAGQPQLKMAMRHAIRDQVIAFRQNSSSVCALCGTLEEPFEVDHHEPQFEQICETFLSTAGNDVPTKFAKLQPDCFTVFCPEDSHFEQIWAKYHMKNAVLRILCRHCNGSRAKG